MASESNKAHQSTKEPVQEPDMDGEQVAAYLEQHPEFFQEYPQVLANMALEHDSGSAASLIERQVQVLRTQHQRSQHRLKELLTTARDNESRVIHLNTLAGYLLAADNLADVDYTVRDRLTDLFLVEDVFLGLLGSMPRGRKYEGVRFVPEADPMREAFRDFLRTGKTECGELTPEKSALLFPERETPAGSAAVVPLDRSSSLGFLVLADGDAGRFTPDMGTWFLELTAQLVAAACKARLPASWS